MTLLALETAPAASTWAIGWEAFVTIGTVALALAAGFLAWSTRDLAKWTVAEVRAQWRPVILPAVTYPNAIFWNQSAESLSIRVQNAGRGPALHIRSHLEPGGISPEHWSLGALAAGEERALTFRTSKADAPLQLLFDYRDLADRTHSTSITIDAVNGDLAFYDVRVWEDHAVTFLGDAIYPQPGLRDVSPKARPSLKTRLRGAVHILRGRPDQ